VQEIGFQPQSVSTIVLTHYHMDHIGSLKELTTITGAKVAVSKIDAAYVSGKQPYPKPKNLLMRAVPLFMKAEPVDVDITLEDGARIGNLLVIETPGHTEGSIMLYDEQRKVLFSGDTLRFDGKKITGGPKQFTWDELKEKESIEKISKLDFDLLLPGHGIFLKGDASRLVEEYLQTIQK
jgi:glyoxylase-like metal-dependent hydrolase (beta-lactamase superfamily II)